MTMKSFSSSLTREYQQEMLITYGRSISCADAERELFRLARTLFPTAVAGNCAESREQCAPGGAAPCARSLSGRIASGSGTEVGASITPTSGQAKSSVV